jgi:hypothetical protein
MQMQRHHRTTAAIKHAVSHTVRLPCSRIGQELKPFAVYQCQQQCKPTGECVRSHRRRNQVQNS